MDAASLLVSVLGLLISLLVLHKVRRIHLATYELVGAAAETKALFAQIQALSSLERKLKLDLPLPSVRGWAGSPDFLLRVHDETIKKKPARVMECSSGVSTIVIARALQLTGNGHVYSLEHDGRYAAKTRSLLVEYGLSSWATVIDAPLEERESGVFWYSESAIPNDLKDVGMLVVDGPPSTTGKLARYPALPVLRKRLAAGAVVIADDTARADEAEMIRRWLKEFPAMDSVDCGCEKGCILLNFTINHKI